jgi:hypothetical protein
MIRTSIDEKSCNEKRKRTVLKFEEKNFCKFSVVNRISAFLFYLVRAYTETATDICKLGLRRYDVPFEWAV